MKHEFKKLKMQKEVNMAKEKPDEKLLSIPVLSAIQELCESYKKIDSLELKKKATPIYKKALIEFFNLIDMK